MPCPHLYNQGFTFTDKQGNPQTFDASPYGWPHSYTDNSGKTYILGCKCEGGVTGGWNTVNWVTRAQCDSTGGSSSIGEGAPESTVGPCGQILVAPSCTQYYNTTSLGGIPVAPIPHNWISNLQLYGELIEVDPCDLTKSRRQGCVDNNGNTIENLSNCRPTMYSAALTVMGMNRYYAGGRRTSERGQYIIDCHGLSNNLEAAGGCCSKLRYQLDKNNTAADRGIKDTFTTGAQEDQPYKDLPITLIPPSFWGEGGRGPGGGPPPPDNDDPFWTGSIGGPSAQETARKVVKILEPLGVIGAGVLVGIVIVSATPVLVGGVVVGGTAVVLVTIYTGDGKAQVISMDVPLGGA